MLWGNELAELKAELARQNRNINEKLDSLENAAKKNNAAVKEIEKIIKEELANLKEELKDLRLKIDQELSNLIKKEAEFERSINSFDNIKNRLDEILYNRIKEITELELNDVKKKIQEFKGIESEIRAISEDLKLLRSDLAKFNLISRNIKEIDFSLEKYAKQLELQDKNKLELEKENENLKHILSRMKRGAQDYRR